MKTAKGTFWNRFCIILLAIVFGVLTFWAVSYLLGDIKVFKMPDRKEYFERHRDHALHTRLEELEAQRKDLQHQHTLLTQQRGFIKDSSGSLQVIVDNLFRLKSKNQDLISTDQFDRVLASLDKIILIQEDYKSTANDYIRITNDKYSLEKEIAALRKRLEENEKNTRNAFATILRKHRIKTTLAKMFFLVPLAILSTVLLVRKRNSIYRLMYWAIALSVYLKISLVMHENFPTRYFKYILIILMLLITGWGFTKLIRRLVQPRLDTLLKQYKEAYNRFLCPVCEFPIRIGPRKYLYWTRRTVHKISLAGGGSPAAELSEPYTCPCCGTCLFEPCSACDNIRHTLLPNCQSCGAVKNISGDLY